MAGFCSPFAGCLWWLADGDCYSPLINLNLTPTLTHTDAIARSSAQTHQNCRSADWQSAIAGWQPANAGLPRTVCGLPVRDTADCQSALPFWRDL